MKNVTSVDGIAVSATPSVKHSVAKMKAPAAKMRSYSKDDINTCPFEANPGMKTFHHAECPDNGQHLPVRAFGKRMVTRGYVGGDDTRGRSQM